MLSYCSSHCVLSVLLALLEQHIWSDANYTACLFVEEIIVVLFLDKASLAMLIIHFALANHWGVVNKLVFQDSFEIYLKCTVLVNYVKFVTLSINFIRRKRVVITLFFYCCHRVKQIFFVHFRFHWTWSALIRVLFQNCCFSFFVLLILLLLSRWFKSM